MTEVMEKVSDWSAAAGLSEQARGFVIDVTARNERAHDKFQEALNTTLEALNETRELGVTLESARGQLSRSQWKLAQAEFPFSERQVQGLLEMARKCPEPITDIAAALRYLPDAQMSLGFAEYPQGHGKQVIHEHNFALIITKELTSFRALLHKELERSPIKDWTPSYARQFAQVNAPLVDDLNRLMAQVVTQAKEAARD